MAIKFNAKKGSKKAQGNSLEVETLQVEDIQVTHVKEWDNGITFDLALNHVFCIYGCRLASNKNGEAFVSLPSRKGKDGKYYSYCYMKLSDEANDAICQRVIDQLHAED